MSYKGLKGQDKQKSPRLLLLHIISALAIFAPPLPECKGKWLCAQTFPFLRQMEIFSGTTRFCCSGATRACCTGTTRSCCSETVRSCCSGTTRSCCSGTTGSCCSGTTRSCDPGTLLDDLSRASQRLSGARSCQNR